MTIPPAIPILVVEDKDSLRELMRKVLAAAGFDVTPAASAEEAALRLKEKPFRLVLTDLRLPGADGHWVLQEAKRLDPQVEVIVLTAYGSIESSVRAVKSGAFDYLTKPVENDHLVEVVRLALSRRGEAGPAPGETGPELVGQSPAFRRALETAQVAAQSDATILLQGESGTGKELFAKFIHRHSKRAAKPFVSLNCGALAPTLFESELFGHEKGSFTGAVERKVGRFEAAAGGTLFLDEVSEIPVESQVKLLRVLQEKEYNRVGGIQTLKSDVRVLAATNRPLLEAIKRGRFREDLYYRLNVIPVTVPPLRDRPGDLESLVKVFLDKFNRQSGKEVSLEESAWAVLKGHAWPGNVRELEHCLQRAVILSRGPLLRGEDLLEPATPSADPKGATLGGLKAVSQLAQTEAEKRKISEVLLEAKGNKSEAARRLGVSYKTLLHKMKDWEL